MLEYFYDTETKEFTYSAEVFTDPLESQNAGHDVYMFSTDATTLEPLEPKDGFAVVFNGAAWEYIEDHRGTVVWKAYDQYMQIKALGAIPEGWAVQQPDKPVSKDDYANAMEQYIAAARIARGYTLREPDVYKDSSVPRWRQDALDFIAFRDSCLLYGQTIINTYTRSGQAPTLDQFKAALAANCPCVWTYSDTVTHEQVIEFLYQQKCRIAYGGVTIVAPNGRFKFETSIDSATMCSCQLHALQEYDESYVVYWKVWQDGVPSVLPLTKPDFKRVFSFSRDMINTAFGVQGMLNSQAAQFTYEQLQDTQFMQTFYESAIARFDAINTELEL